MSDPSPTRSARPPVIRIADALPGGLATAGVLFVLTLMGVYLAVELALGHDPLRPRPGDALHARGETLITLLLLSVLAYLLASRAAVRRQMERTALALRPLVTLAPEAFQRAVREAGAARGVGAIAFGLALTAVALGVPLLEVGEGPWQPYDVSQWSSAVAWHRVLTPLLGWHAGRLIHAMLHGSVALSRLSAHIDRIDLLDLTPLAPLARQGLANALWLMGFVALFAVLLADFDRYGIAVAAVGALTFALGAAALLVPVQGARRRIRREKQEELARIAVAIRGVPDALAASPIGPRAAQASLSDLLEWRRFVEGVREWPLDSAVLARFALYLLIPVGSWAGGALVERGLDRLLG